MSLFTFAAPGWNALAFALPAWSVLKCLGSMIPQSYKEYDALPKSPQAATIYAIVQKALDAENVAGSEHFERIQEMLQELPESAEPKTTATLLQHRLKVVNKETNSLDAPVHATGTDAHGGKYFIAIKPDSQTEPALHWIVTHEFSHILNDDALNLTIVKTCTSLGAALFSIFALGLSLPASVAAVMVTNVVTHTMCSQMAERSADNFANKHCSKEELKHGIAFLEFLKARKATHSYANRFFSMLLHPSEDSRIANIRKALLEKAKAA